MIFFIHQIHQRRDIEQGNEERDNEASYESYRHRSE